MDMVCSRCGAKIRNGTFCPMCGYDMSDQQRIAKEKVDGNLSAAFGYQEKDNSIIPDYVEKPKKSHKMLWIILLIVVILLIGAGITTCILLRNRPRQVTYHYVDKQIYYLNSTGDLCRENGDGEEVMNVNIQKKIPQDAVSVAGNDQHNRYLYVQAVAQGFQIHSLDENSDTMVQKEAVQVHNLIVSNNGEYGAYAISHPEVRQVEDRKAEGGVRQETVQVYELFKVNKNNENIKIQTQDYELEPVSITNEGYIVYSSSGKEKTMIYENGTKETKFAEDAVRMVFFEQDMSYVYENNKKEIFKGGIRENEVVSDQLLTTDVSLLYEMGGKQIDRITEDGLALTQVTQYTTSQSTNPRIVYQKGNAIYYKDLSEDGDSIKLFNDSKNISNIRFASETCVYYQSGLALNRLDYTDGEWKSTQLQNNVTAYDVLEYSNDYVYVSNSTLYYVNSDTDDSDDSSGELLINNVSDQANVYLTSTAVFYQETDGQSRVFDLEQKEESNRPLDYKSIWITLTEKELIRYE